MKDLRDISLSSNDRLAIEEACRRLRERFPVEQVILFGSKARGTDDRESDIDLLLLTARRLSTEEEREVTDLLFPIQLERDVVFSPLIVPTREWREGVYQAMPLRREIDASGVAA
jgi:predicted nucleotidyltransferase